MSSKLKINGKRLVALRRSPRQLQILTAYGTAVARAADRDFFATASRKEIHIFQKMSRSPTPYDVTARTAPDRVRVYVQSASLPSRRHEKSTRGSSLLRAAHNKGK